MSELIDIDGSVLEGGGQILRLSVSFSAILGVPIRVFNIRAKRSKPGLAAQHLIGIKLVADMCGAKLKGDSIGSTEIEFRPGSRLKGGHYVADTRTAGSISLLLQVALPCALLADGPVTLDLKGGTNADMAPQFDYMTEVFLPVLKKFGARFDFTIHRRGYYPKGGGFVSIEVMPVKKFLSVNMTERGNISRIFGWSFVAGTLPIKLANEMSEGLKEGLQDIHVPVEIEVYKELREIAPNNCSGIIVVCETSLGCVLGADGLGRRGQDARGVGRDAAGALRRGLAAGGCADTHLQDQLLIYMALAEGKSAVRVGEITLHTKTAIHIAEKVAQVKFEVIEEDEQNIIQCNGIGILNKYYPGNV
ncbi:RNA 3'-terminal phosphate cyclase [Trichoplusia ni]|uniref:RNA 3'-terminal phosphate cyclase n=1 Tax=Trichoplusia ni TaxID=7111 RepID=A0A7E5WSU3_TRINI|nr:RNA 3'-terminal phosphate cyclase [Trichoplusia ni]